MPNTFYTVANGGPGATPNEWYNQFANAVSPLMSQEPNMSLIPTGGITPFVPGYDGPIDTAFTGSNQYGSYPSVGSGGMSNMSGAGTPGMSSTVGNAPGIVPPQSNPFTNVPTTGPQGTAAPTWPIAPSANSQFYAGYSYNPNLTANLFSMLQSQIGKGVTPFNLSALLPSSGAATNAGTLTAPNNQILQNLFSAFTGQGSTSNVPGLQTLTNMSATGNPIDQTPAWKAMVDSMQQQIQQQEANLKEQFNVGGNLVGSPYGNALSNFESQTASTLNSQLLGAQTTALENAAQRQLTAGQDLSGMSTQLGSLFQGLDQQSITNLLNEFIRTSPQNNPLLNAEYGAATTFPAYLAKSSGLTGLGAVVGNLGPLASMASGGISGGLGAAGGGLGAILAGILGGICWVSRALYGDESPRVPVIRRTLLRIGATSPENAALVWWYITEGPAIAFLIKNDASKKIDSIYRKIFDAFYNLGVETEGLVEAA